MSRIVEPHLTLSLGGLSLALTTSGAGIVAPDDDVYRPFTLARGAACPSGEPIGVRLEVEPSPAFEGEVIFHSSASWAIRARGRERGIVAWTEEPLYAVDLRPGAAQVLVRCGPGLLEPGPPPAIRSPVHYPLDQILVMYLLGESGLILHAAGMLVRGRGVALAGVSGAGKTTFSRLAAGRADWQPLSDDRVIVRVGPERAVLHGTPWPGEGRIAVNAMGPLRGLLFLEQGATNAVRRLAAPEAAARLVKTASIPWFDERYVGDGLRACGRIVADVPAAVLTFRPEVAAVEAVERWLDAEVP